MDIQEFLDLCIGNWFSQRSRYYFEEQKAESHKSELTVEWLSSDHQDVIALCQPYQIAPQTALGGQKICWDNSVDWGNPKQAGSAMLVVIPDTNIPDKGIIIKTMSSPQASPLKGSYSLGQDEALTLILKNDSTYLEERLWFASPNLRLRTNLVRSANGFSQTVFYTEIRKLPPKETT